MPDYDFSSQRLFVNMPLAEGNAFELSRDQANYLLNVLRLQSRKSLLVFNGQDGEWRAEIFEASRKSCSLRIHEQKRPQPRPPELCYAFAPIKSARLDYMVQKAVEMGATKLLPVLTRRTQVSRLNLDRMRANVIEAAEQCGILSIADVLPEIKFEAFMKSRQEMGTGTLVFCDEDAQVGDPVTIIRAAASQKVNSSPSSLWPVCVLIGPEGGFDPAERAALNGLQNIISLSLGPRILRADTAAVAALAIVQAAIGDWV